MRCFLWTPKAEHYELGDKARKTGAQGFSLRLEVGKAEDRTEGQFLSPELKCKMSSQSLLMGGEGKWEGQNK